jgi:hypothetical protein
MGYRSIVQYYFIAGQFRVTRQLLEDVIQNTEGMVVLPCDMRK